LGCCTERLAGLGEQEPGSRHVASRKARCGCDFVCRTGVAQLGFDSFGRNRDEVDRLAAGGNRLKELGGLSGKQEDVDESRGLLERLQQRVLALVAHLLGGLDNEDALLRFEGSVSGRTDHFLANLLDHVLGAAGAQPDKVRVRRGVEQSAAAGVLGVGGAAGEDLGRESASGGGLTRAARTAEEICVRRGRGKCRPQHHPRSSLMLGRDIERVNHQPAPTPRSHFHPRSDGTATPLSGRWLERA